MRIKGVVNTTAATARLAGQCKLETKFCAAQADVLTVGVGLFSTNAVFLRDVFGDFLTNGCHVRVEFKRLEDDVSGDVWLDIGQRLVKRLQTNHAPGA